LGAGLVLVFLSSLAIVFPNADLSEQDELPLIRASVEWTGRRGVSNFFLKLHSDWKRCSATAAQCLLCAIIDFLLENKKVAFQMPRGRQSEKLSKSPAGASRALLRSRCLRDRSIGWDGEIAAYANKQHRHIVDAIGL